MNKNYCYIDDSNVPILLNAQDIFLNLYFRRNRIIILKTDKNKTTKHLLKEYCSKKNLLYTSLGKQPLYVDYIRGAIEVNEDMTYYRKKPEYIENKKQMIIVEHLNKSTDINLVKAFCYMACEGEYSNSVGSISNDCLPSGSNFVFIANSDFPYDKFRSIVYAQVLDLRDFQVKVKEHMTMYRIKVLGIKSSGKWRDEEYSHILENKKLNVLDTYRQAFFSDKLRASIKLHEGFANLNSSQAMCINFFYPLIVEKKLDLITKLFQLNGQIDYSTVEFEKESCIEEGKNRKTNFDFFFQVNDETTTYNVYVEVKYTENEFGSTKGGEGHNTDFQNVYSNLVNKAPFTEAVKEKEFFFKNYQIMRNLVHIDDNSFVIFLYPESNERIRKPARNAKTDFLTENYKSHLLLLTLEKLLTVFDNKLDGHMLQNYYKEFENKYILKN